MSQQHSAQQQRLTAPEGIQPPKAAEHAYTQRVHGHTLSDPFHWLRDAGYPDVSDEAILSYINAENAYRETVTKPWASAEDAIFAEIKSRISEKDSGVPWQDGAFELTWDFDEGADYRRWSVRPARLHQTSEDVRAHAASSAEGWQTLFDESAAAQGSDFYRLAALSLSPDGRWLAVSEDRNGSERFSVRLIAQDAGASAASKQAAEAVIVTETSGEIIWDAQSRGFFYVVVSAEWRPYLLRWQSIQGGAPVDIYREEDSSHFVHISKSGRGRHLLMTTGTHVTSEVHVLALSGCADTLEAERALPEGALVCVRAGSDGHQYSLSEGEAGWWVLSNKDHKNFGLYFSPSLTSEWQPCRLGDDSRYVRDIVVLKDRLFLSERVDGRDEIAELDAHGTFIRLLAFAEDARAVSFSVNRFYSAPYVRLSYTSMITPHSVLDYTYETETTTVRKVEEIPAGYNKDDYASERLMVRVRDGAEVPVSIVYKKGWAKQSGAPLHLYGYGAYAIGMDPSFSAPRLSLLDRGFAYAIAHIRGGDELGYGWYEAGKLDVRTNTFNDFVDVARHLISEGYVRAGQVTISGGSAGGELMGAVVNQAPELFAASVLHVPFVDVLNTMLDASLSLTPMEWPEWGNPIEDAAAFENIKSYCPYTNLAGGDYPAMLVTGGLTDPRVTYWEPLKWTAKLRHIKTTDSLLLMKMNMGAGHAGKSGRFERYREVAEEYVFLIKAAEAAGAVLLEV